MFFFMTTNKKGQCYPLWFFFMTTKKKTTVLPPMFYLINIDRVAPYVYFMTADKKQQYYPFRRFCGDPNLSCLEC